MKISDHQYVILLGCCLALFAGCSPREAESISTLNGVYVLDVTRERDELAFKRAFSTRRYFIFVRSGQSNDYKLYDIETDMALNDSATVISSNVFNGDLGAEGVGSSAPVLRLDRIAASREFVGRYIAQKVGEIKLTPRHSSATITDEWLSSIHSSQQKLPPPPPSK